MSARKSCKTDLIPATCIPLKSKRCFLELCKPGAATFYRLPPTVVSRESLKQGGDLTDLYTPLPLTLVQKEICFVL